MSERLAPHCDLSIGVCITVFHVAKYPPVCAVQEAYTGNRSNGLLVLERIVFGLFLCSGRNISFPRCYLRCVQAFNSFKDFRTEGITRNSGAVTMVEKVGKKAASCPRFGKGFLYGCACKGLSLPFEKVSRKSKGSHWLHVDQLQSVDVRKKI